MSPQDLGKISARPVKSFFVQMLIRDIDLKDAILDLLDNCVDGIQRTEKKAALKKQVPYKGYWAKISFSRTGFAIEDNCGGIPWGSRDYAYRMGPARDGIGRGRRTVGVYGIGMKRAIFKMGRDCTIATHAKDMSYEVRFSPKWMQDDEEWDIKATEIAEAIPKGTSISISKLHSSIGRAFSSKEFEDDFYEEVATHYAYIMDKGFKVFVNGRVVRPKAIRLLFAERVRGESISPFVYETNYEGVDVFLAVGFTRPIPSREEADDSHENYKERYSSSEAGWTVICNDRTVLYADKTAKTGWGVSGVPQYHTQFVAISGIVIFGADDPKLLPTTTTKRGIEISSDLYMLVRDRMIEGMKLFTQYTNQWKEKELVTESRRRFRETPLVDLSGLRGRTARLPMASTRGILKGRRHRPRLPRPKTKTTQRRISFTRPPEQIKKVSSYLFDTPDRGPSDVGQECFDLFLQEAKE